MEEKNIIIELKERALERVKNHQEEIRQNELFVRCCDDTSMSIADPAVFKKIKYNAMNAKNAAENPDVAPVDDKDRAETAIKDASVQLMTSKKNLEVILDNLNEVNRSSLEGEVADLRNYVSDNKELDEKWINYSQDVLNGNYYEFNEKEKVEYQKQEEVFEDLSNEPNNVVEETNEVIEPVVEEPQEVAEEEKVVSVEPFVRKENTEIDALSQELDAELDKALKPIQEDINNIKGELEPEIAPVEPEIVDNTDLSNAEPADFFSFNSDIEPKEDKVEETIESAANVDEGAVKVVKVEEVGAPEQNQDEDYTRRLAA